MLRTRYVSFAAFTLTRAQAHSSAADAESIVLSCETAHAGRTCVEQIPFAGIAFIKSQRQNLAFYLALKVALKLYSTKFGRRRPLGLGQELSGFLRTIAFLFAMPASFFVLLCSLNALQRRSGAARQPSGDADGSDSTGVTTMPGLSVATVQRCSVLCGMIGVLFEHPTRWERVAHFMIAASL